MKKKNVRNKIQRLAMAGVLLALILVFLLVPIPSISGVSYAVIAIIAVIIACQFDGFFMGLFCGFAFGLASLIGSFTTGAGSVLAFAFHNPLISILPRVLIGVTCYFSYVGLRKFFMFLYSHRKKYNEKVANHLSIIVSSGVSSAIAVITNTALVMTMIYVFHAGDALGDNTIGTALLWGIVVTNAPLELAVCVPVSTAVLVALKATFHKTRDKYYFKNESIVANTCENVEECIIDESASLLGCEDAKNDENDDIATDNDTND